MTTFGRQGKREVSQQLSVCVFRGASLAARNRDDVQSNHSTQINEKGTEYADI